MDDLISRQAALEIIQSLYPGMPRVPWLRKDWQKRYEPYINAEKAIRALPSAQPEQRWIPVSERLPEDEKEVLVTRHFLSDNQLKKNAITESFYVEVASRMDDEWISYSDEYKIKRHLHKVIAWMPLPKPWKGERQ